ncbi:bacitracin ABC transporter ATP-binding protein [Bacillus canaveralius]|uniref:Bacitracin ABC transporter ATP-binding protein n=1 Tax=Bacillus canaveralius TaxID=1403243 RepID=A0A2N5GFZ1_9BACI|nr:ABC transporter ATP-binding protein [Bacillus canaveralius]PLR79678.1 bacitracin ABC transporter ATP-binding protein [Bacillus canaveralius]PLR91978.1 bacitracin ABC transporter ATP-binding protein [Bacillus canaveralius]
MAQYALEVQSLTKRIGKKTIVDDVSFSIEKGEIFGLLGPNGAGKTTIIRMIVSLINRTGGHVIVNGHNLDEAFKETMSEIGAIVENPEFYKYMSGYKNLIHYARMADKEIPESRIEEVIELVGLKNAIHNKVKTYSLGMRQRLGVAQALLHNPSLLVLDEPTNGLDPQGIREFRDYLHSLASQGISVLVSSHLLSEMQLMCNRFAIIDKGKLTHISNMNDSVEGSDQELRDVIFEVENVENAVELLKTNGLIKEVKASKGQEFTIAIKRDTIARANQILVQNNIDVYGISSVKATLEDRFLELTNKDQKEQSL